VSARPYGLLAMSPYARGTAMPDPVFAELTRFAELDAALLVSDFAATDPAVLARAEFLVTGWGCPCLGEAQLSAMPSLRLIAHAAGSVKHHLDDAVWRRGITVSSAASANARPVAEYTRAMVMLACKRVFVRAAEYPTKGWPDNQTRLGTGYVRRTVGIIGASRIGKLTMELLRRYDMRLLLHDPYASPELATEFGADLVSLDELCERSDVVSVHAPELPETRRLLDDRRLSLMRDGTVLINTARGSLVDTDALVAHCRTGRIDAILDVTEPEPLPGDHPLLHLPNVMVTPHLAGAQGSEIALLGEYAVAEVRRFFAGEPLHGKVELDDLSTVA
jgi:phosphoglycerate dehydrogenase-like enzyme